MSESSRVVPTRPDESSRVSESSPPYRGDSLAHSVGSSRPQKRMATESVQIGVVSGCGCPACRQGRYQVVWHGAQRGAAELLSEYPWDGRTAPSQRTATTFRWHRLVGVSSR